MNLERWRNNRATKICVGFLLAIVVYFWGLGAGVGLLIGIGVVLFIAAVGFWIALYVPSGAEARATQDSIRLAVQSGADAAAAADAHLICPHCQTRGTVSTVLAKVKNGISAGKVTGAVLTAGYSVLATGLSSKKVVTQAHCGTCRASWTF